MNPEEQQLFDALIASAGLNGIAFRVIKTSGCWIIEGVSANITPQNRRPIIEEIFQVLDQEFGPGETVWKLFLYDNPNARFSVTGTLHTEMYRYEGTIYTTTLAANDCYLDMTEYDAEALQLGERPGLVVIGKESRAENGNPILPYVTTATYLWLETLGGSYHIAPNGTQRNGAGIVSVTLA